MENNQGYPEIPLNGRSVIITLEDFENLKEKEKKLYSEKVITAKDGIEFKVWQAWTESDFKQFAWNIKKMGIEIKEIFPGREN